MAAYNAYQQINSGNVVVPNDFFGCSWWGYPASNPWPDSTASAAKVNFQAANTWGWGYPWGAQLSWCNIEQTPGTYTWGQLDTWVATMWARGVRSLTFSTTLMPCMASSDTFGYSANPTTPSNLSIGGGKGQAGPLTTTVTTGTISGIQGLYNFINAVIARYKAKGTPFKYVQVWQEPQFAGTSGGPSAYWWGTAAQMVDLAIVGYYAAKDADPNITVLSISASPPAGYPNDWINATGTGVTIPGGHGVTSSFNGKQSYDYLAWDCFGFGPTYFPYGFDFQNKSGNVQFLSPTYSNNPTFYNDIVTIHNGTFVPAASGKPVVITSMGLTAFFYDTGAAAFNTYLLSQTPAWRNQWISRMLTQCAGLGYKQVHTFGMDSWTTQEGGGKGLYTGDFTADSAGVVAGFNATAAALAGKTITFCGVRGDGQTFARLSDGTNYIV